MFWFSVLMFKMNAELVVRPIDGHADMTIKLRFMQFLSRINDGDKLGKSINMRYYWKYVLFDSVYSYSNISLPVFLCRCYIWKAPNASRISTERVGLYLYRNRYCTRDTWASVHLNQGNGETWELSVTNVKKIRL